MSVADFKFDIHGDVIEYYGNTKLKTQNTELAWTPEHIFEYERCRDDIEYFAQMYYYIVNLDEGLIKINLRDYQKDIVHKFEKNRFNIVMASRQCGKSTIYEVFLLHYILFKEHKSAVILANKESTAIKLLARVKQAYEMLPKWLQQGVTEWNKKSIHLENGCELNVAATSSSAIRGMSVNLLIIDECAFIPKNMFDEFYGSVYPTISSAKTTQVIMVSTPNGKNHFYKLWMDATKEKSTYVHSLVLWNDVPGRDAAWAKETKANIGEEKFMQEFECSFLGASHSLLNAHVLNGLTWEDPLEESECSLYAKLGDHKNKLKVYQRPQARHIYSMGVDSSKISEEIQGDAITMHVLDITSIPFVQVATFYADKNFSYLEAPEIAFAIASYYAEALMFVENNEIGQEIADIIFMDYEYENMYFEKGQLPGFRTTKKTKRIGCSNLRLLVENEKLIVNDFETISQLSTFVRHKTSYAAEMGYFDDAVLALIGSLFFLQDAQYNHYEDKLGFIGEVMNKSVKRGEGEKEGENVDDDVPAFGFTSDSLDSPTDSVF